MMALNSTFQFSQSSLQDYVACPRRFELRYIEKRRWPALQSEPVLDQERHMQQGQRFHQLVHQYILGIPVDEDQFAVEDSTLLMWWGNFKQASPLSTLPVRRYPEHILTAHLAGFRIMAKYDLLAVQPENCMVIVDWKTGYTPKRGRLKSRIQSRLYPYLLVEAGTYLNAGISIHPEQVQMIYWFASSPEDSVMIEYNQKMYQDDRAFLAELITEITTRPSGQFLLAEDERTCAFCIYRSLCGRGVKAGNWNDVDGELDDDTSPSIDLDLDQIGEIAF
jgi:CRISPR/Cas system-associated exonuclease Cas4 (RecB family)